MLFSKTKLKQIIQDKFDSRILDLEKLLPDNPMGQQAFEANQRVEVTALLTKMQNTIDSGGLLIEEEVWELGNIVRKPYGAYKSKYDDIRASIESAKANRESALAKVEALTGQFSDEVSLTQEDLKFLGL